MRDTQLQVRAIPSWDRLAGRLRNWLDRRGSESVYFYALHKCATSLFNRHVLDHVGDRRRVDFAAEISNNTLDREITFERSGHLYGAIYVVRTQGVPTYDQFTRIVTDPGFVRDKTAAFLVRDPRDILISQYYSFGFTHAYAENASLRRQQERLKASIEAKGVDDYVIEAAPELRVRFDLLHDLVCNCRRSAVLRYEDLVDDFDRFIRDLEDIFRFRLREEIRREVYERSRPRETEDRTAHKRSGKVGQYRELLAPQTLERVNDIFATTLERFGYEKRDSGSALRGRSGTQHRTFGMPGTG